MTKSSDEFPPPFRGKGGSGITGGDFPPAGDRAEDAVEGACAVERA